MHDLQLDKSRIEPLMYYMFIFKSANKIGFVNKREKPWNSVLGVKWNDTSKSYVLRLAQKAPPLTLNPDSTLEIPQSALYTKPNNIDCKR